MAHKLDADPEGTGATDDGIDQTRIGQTIRRLRLERNLTLAELALQSGVAVGLLSEIERDIANPSLRTLTRIRHVLGVPLSVLFEDPPGTSDDPDFVRRGARRPRLDLGPRLMVKELLSSPAASTLQFMILDLQPGGGSGPETLAYPGEKAGLVLEGQLSLEVEGTEAMLEVGDSFQFDSERPHAFRNTSSLRARVLWIIGQTIPSRPL